MLHSVKQKALMALPEQAAIATLECYGWTVQPITRYAVTNPATGETMEMSGSALRELIIAQMRLDRPLVTE